MKTRTSKEKAEREAKRHYVLTGETIEVKPKKRTPIKKRKATKPKVPSVAMLDSLFSQYVRERALNECQLWGVGGIQCSTQMQCSHIKSRIYHSVRWNPLNAICACAAHHRLQHREPDANYRALVEILGEDHLHELQRVFLDGKKPTPDEKRAIKKWLEDQLAELACKSAA